MKQANLQANFELPIVFSALAVSLLSSPVFALNPSLDISQYAHTAWTFRNGFLNGAVYAIAQTADGYLWLGTQSGVVRFDGVRAVPLVLPTRAAISEHRGWGPSSRTRRNPLDRDPGRAGELEEWSTHSISGARPPHCSSRSCEERDGTVWAGAFGSPTGKLCAIRGGSTTCYGDDGKSRAPLSSSLYEDTDGSLWVGAATGLWRWNPGPPTRYLATPIPSSPNLHARRSWRQTSSLPSTASVRSSAKKFLNYPLQWSAVAS